MKNNVPRFAAFREGRVGRHGYRVWPDRRWHLRRDHCRCERPRHQAEYDVQQHLFAAQISAVG